MIPKKMFLLVGRSSLSTIIKMSTRAFVVVMTNLIDRIFMDLSIIIEDLMYSCLASNFMWGIDGSVKEIFINGRSKAGGGAATTSHGMTEVGIIDIKSRIISKTIVEKNIIGRRHARDVNFDGIYSE
jgi:hypothetical protein